MKIAEREIRSWLKAPPVCLQDLWRLDKISWTKELQRLVGGLQQTLPALEVIKVFCHQSSVRTRCFQGNQKIAKMPDKVHLSKTPSSTSQNVTGFDPGRNGRVREMT